MKASAASTRGTAGIGTHPGLSRDLPTALTAWPQSSHAPPAPRAHHRDRALLFLCELRPEHTGYQKSRRSQPSVLIPPSNRQDEGVQRRELSWC